MLKGFASNYKRFVQNNCALNYLRPTRSYFTGLNDNKIYLVCITGGPCSGKTTILNHLVEKFQTKFKIFVVNELATSIMSSGVNLDPAEWTIPEHEILTEHFMKHQMNTK